MELMEIDAEEYEKVIDKHEIVFCQSSFLELNRYKVEKVRYFLGGDAKKRVALAVGEKEKTWSLPFSAPFGMPLVLKARTGIEYFGEFIRLLKRKAEEEHIKRITFFLPPMFYGEEQISKWINALLLENFYIKTQDLNFQFNLKEICEENYHEKMERNARKNLNIARKENLKLIYCGREENQRDAYEIIERNRREKGYPLRMNYDQIKETIQAVPADFFIVAAEEYKIAAAIVFQVRHNVMQVIYWGDIQGYGEKKPINYLAFELIKYYKEKDIEYLDIGPSTENGIPMIGLCNFKESIGCSVSSKFMLELSL